MITKKKNAINTARRSRVKTYTKKATTAIDGGNKDAAILAVRSAESQIMKATGKVMPKKRAARKVSRLTKRIANMP